MTLQADGTEPLFSRLEQVLHEKGFLVPQGEEPHSDGHHDASGVTQAGPNRVGPLRQTAELLRELGVLSPRTELDLEAQAPRGSGPDNTTEPDQAPEWWGLSKAKRKLLNEAVRNSRLLNMSELDRAREQPGLRSAMDQMISGGATTTFELPTPYGVQKLTAKLITEREYPDEDNAHGGVEHEWTLPDVQTMSYSGSTMAGEERSSSTPLEWNAGVTGGVANPLRSRRTTQPMNQILGGYTYNRHTEEVHGSGSGIGHEYYELSPTENGLQIFRARVIHRLELSFSHGDAPEPSQSNGTVRWAVPTYRTLTSLSQADRTVPPTTPAPTAPEPATTAPTTPPPVAARPYPVRIRELTEADTTDLALPGVGHTYHNGRLKLPEVKLIRLEGSKALKLAAHDMAAGLSREAAELERAAQQAPLPPVPGAWPQDDPPGDTHGGAAEGDETRDDADAQTGRNRTSPEEPTPVSRAVDDPGHDLEAQAEPPQSGGLTNAFAGAAKTAAMFGLRWVAESTGAAGTWRFVRQLAVGEPAANPESASEQVYQVALSPEYLSAKAPMIFLDSFIIEGAGTSGAVAGGDSTLEVQGFITNVRLLERPPKLDSELWRQAMTSSMTAESLTVGHSFAGSLAGQYGSANRSYNPSGTYQPGVSTTEGSMVNDNTTSFHVTTEDTAQPHRFAADVVYVLTGSRGVDNIATGTVYPLVLEDTRVVEEPDGLEFLMFDSDLRNHPELLGIDGVPTLPAGNPLDRRLPSWFIESGGVLTGGAVTGDELKDGRKAYFNSVVNGVEKEAPGATRLGHATFMRPLARINELTSSMGRRTLPHAGPNGWIAFHFVHRSTFGPRLVEVALSARPAPGTDLAAIRGRKTETTSGVDTVVRHSTGEGAALPVLGATRVSTTRTVSHKLGFAPLGQVSGNQSKPQIRLSGSRSSTYAQTSSREEGSWKRTADSVDFTDVPYVYEWKVSSRILDEALLVRLISSAKSAMGTGVKWAADVLAWAGRATGILDLPDHVVLDLPDDVVRQLVHPVSQNTGQVEALLSLRLDADETPADGGLRAASVRPALHSVDDPALTREPPQVGNVTRIGPDDVPENLRKLVNSPHWVPSRAFHIYRFTGMPQLRQALRDVDPSPAKDLDPEITRSAEGMSIRLKRLVAANRLTPMEPAALAPFLGHPGGKGISMRFAVYFPRAETTSKNVAIDHVWVFNDGFIRQTTQSTTSSLGFGGSPVSADATNRGGPSIPLLGGTENFGHASSLSSQRRDLHRIGTPREGADGSGLTGHRARGIGLVEILGPTGIRRWIVGDLIFRTTEELPDAAGVAEALEAIHGAPGEQQHGVPAVEDERAASPQRPVDDRITATPREPAAPTAGRPDRSSETVPALPPPGPSARSDKVWRQLPSVRRLSAPNLDAVPRTGERRQGSAPELDLEPQAQPPPAAEAPVGPVRTRSASAPATPSGGGPLIVSLDADPRDTDTLTDG